MMRAAIPDGKLPATTRAGRGRGRPARQGETMTPIRSLAAAAAFASLGMTGCVDALRSGNVLDEARLAGRDAASFPHADEDYFRGMDPGVALTPDEIRGRNMWIVWTGGNDKFWDVMTTKTFGAFDLLQIVTSHPSMRTAYAGAPLHRAPRWRWVGLSN